MIRILCCVFLLLSTQCTLDPVEPGLKLRSYSIHKLPGWNADSLHEILPAFRATCRSIQDNPDDKKMGFAGAAHDWKPICREIEKIEPNSQHVRAFFVKHFSAYKAYNNHEDTGLFTGYFEPELRGSLTKEGPYQYPLYTLPKDIVLIDDLGQFVTKMKGERLAGRLQGNRFVPYDDRSTIDQKGLGKQSDVLVWVDSDIDAFFLHIQGSGRVVLDDGRVIRLGYDGHNGHIYYPIGRYLVETGAIKRDKISMQTIMTWLRENPDVAQMLMHKNPSYIFFKQLNHNSILGGAGVPLTGGRSLAIDRRFIPYGVPIWIDIVHPEAKDMRLQRLVMTQDTGGAIRGPIRGDLFWGAGPAAEKVAGEMKSKGGYFILLPKSVDVPQTLLVP